MGGMDSRQKLPCASADRERCRAGVRIWVVLVADRETGVYAFLPKLPLSGSRLIGSLQVTGDVFFGEIGAFELFVGEEHGLVAVVR